MIQILMILVGAGLGLLGLVVTLGAALTAAASDHLLGHALLTLGFGVLPMVIGGILIFRAFVQLGHRRREGIERRVLDLARRRNGVLTASEVARSTRLTLEESRRLLDEIHISGHCVTDLADDGTLRYRFGELIPG